MKSPRKTPRTTVKTKMIRGLAVIGLGMGLALPSAQAALIEMDLDAVGDKLLTLDTSTGFEWLDVTATLGLSYNQALAMPLVMNHGFRHATTDEVAALYFEFGITNQSGTYSAVNFTGTQLILSMMGCTGSCGTNVPFQRGHAESVPFSATNANAPIAQSRLSNSNGRGSVPDSSPSKGNASSIRGNYLVREAQKDVPEPFSILLFGTGLMILGAQAKSRSGR